MSYTTSHQNNTNTTVPYEVARNSVVVDPFYPKGIFRYIGSLLTMYYYVKRGHTKQ